MTTTTATAPTVIRVAPKATTVSLDAALHALEGMRDRNEYILDSACVVWTYRLFNGYEHAWIDLVVSRAGGRIIRAAFGSASGGWNGKPRGTATQVAGAVLRAAKRFTSQR